VQHRKIIRPFLGAILLVLFTFSITPKLFWHDLVADHRDTIGYHSYNDDQSHITAAGFNCDCNTLVVTVPFIEQPDPVSTPVTPVPATIPSVIAVQIFSCTHDFFQLRGPPSIV